MGSCISQEPEVDFDGPGKEIKVGTSLVVTSGLLNYYLKNAHTLT